MKQLTRNLLLAAGLAMGRLTVFAQTNAALPPADDLRAMMEMVRSDVSALKIRALNQTMQLTAAEAEKFWPIYRQYEKELAAVADKKLALLREFGERCYGGTLDNPASDRMSRRWLQIVQARLDLWKKYQRKVARALSPARAAQFLQVEHQMALFIDLNISLEMPTLRMVTRPAKP